MQWIIGFIILALIANAMGIWFWIIAFGIGGIWLASWWMEESNLTDEEREERRREKREREQAAYMAGVEEARLKRQLEIQAEHERKQRKASLLGGLGGTAAKVGVSLAIKALTGANHNHRHH